MKKIAIIGGGNIGTQFACVCASKGYHVNVYSSKPLLYSGNLKIVENNNSLICEGTIFRATDNLDVAIKDCDIIFVTYPASQLTELAEKMLPLVKPKTYIGVIPGTGGAEFAFQDCINKGAVLFGLQRVPAVARLVEYGKSVRVTGKRDKLHLAAIPQGEAKWLAEFMSELFDMPCEILPNYLCVTLTPSNPILHTTRLCSMFSNYAEGIFYPNNPLFYGEWTDDSSALLFACDEELQKICHCINAMDLETVKSLKLHYESNTPQKLTQKIRSIKSFQGLLSPMRKMENGWIPDFDSRYFSTDFPYGLAIIEDLARIVNCTVPNINYTMDWYRNVTGNKKQFEFSKYGISTSDDIYAFYNA